MPPIPKKNWRSSWIQPLSQLAQQATNILIPALSALCIAGKLAVDKAKK
ncbi:MAG TPA: hypothetical protein VGK06_11890 [Methanosarcina sp.]